ncbi:MAG: class I SAM-dependent methyltransferase, partial [Bacteroidia bacterium]
MKENKYDDPVFYDQYSKMRRSQNGLESAGEWHIFRKMLPDMAQKKVLDLGCGFGWHCRYAMEHGAKNVTGVDISYKMLNKAEEINSLPGIQYIRVPVEDANFPVDEFDVVQSSLVFHYVEDFDKICSRVLKWLKPQGHFVFSVEHPVFTAIGSQDWIYGKNQEKLYWPVDNYFIEGKRETAFLGEKVIKYHRTLTTYLDILLNYGFKIKEVKEPTPDESLLETIP